jgi:hypothetical protein
MMQLLLLCALEVQDSPVTNLTNCIYKQTTWLFKLEVQNVAQGRHKFADASPLQFQHMARGLKRISMTTKLTWNKSPGYSSVSKTISTFEKLVANCLDSGPESFAWDHSSLHTA